MIKGFKIAEGNEYINKLKQHRDTYNDRGKFLGFINIDELYTMQLGTCTDWTGFPRSGKTQVLMELLLNSSSYDGWKHLVYFPDVGSDVEIIADLMHKLTGKTFDPKYKNKISDHEIEVNLSFIFKHFYILTKEDVKAKMTPYQFWDYAVELDKEVSIQTASIDSWKDMRHDTSKFGRDDKYLEDVLSYRNAIAEKNDLHLHTIIHPKSLAKENGVRPAPTPYDLKGGSEWFNSGKCMVTIHRENLESTECQFIVNKVKPRSCGKEGFALINFDPSKLVYYEMHEGNKRYASSDTKNPNVIPYEVPLRPNTDFENELLSPF